MNHTIRTEILINAPAERIWSILVDFDTYPSWNPFMTSIKGAARRGEKLEVTFSLPSREPVCICPKVTVCEPHRELRWLGRPGGIPCVATGEHYFELEKLSETETRFHHGEKLFGIIVPFMGAIWAETEGRFNEMNEVLKKRAES